MVVIKFPFTSFQQFNLDWIMEQLHKMLQFMPMNGVAGDVLQRNVDGAVWMPLTSVSLDIHSMSTIPEVEGADELAIYDNSLQGNYKGTVADILALVPPSPVSSVNGQTGAVSLSIPTDTSDLTNGAGFVNAAGAAAAAPVQSVNGQTGAVIVSGGAVDSVNGKTGTVILDKTDIGLGNVANVAQYSASNPPPYPVTSVNGQTGDVIVSGGSAVNFGNPQPLTISSHPSDVTVSSYSLYGEVSNDGKYIRISGNLITTNATDTAGWKGFTVTGLTITPPATNRQVQNCGIAVTSPTGVNPIPTILFDQHADVVIEVSNVGTITLYCYYASILDSEVHYFSFMPFTVSLA